MKPTWKTAIAPGAACGALALFAVAGPLDPPGGAPAPTMKTLDQVEPRTAVNAANTPGDSNSLFKIVDPGSYYLTGDVAGAANKHGIEIAATGVTLDLNGFDLVGVSGSLDGVNVSGFPENLHIRNGSIRNWGDEGVDAGAASNGSVRDVRLYNNAGSGLRIGSSSVVEAVVARENGVVGIFASNDCVIRACAVRQNGSHGVEAFSGASVLNCTAARNVGDGINVRSGSVVADCTASFNEADGIVASDQCTIRDNVSRENDVVGIRVGSDCLVRGNTASSHLIDGIVVEGDQTVVVKNLCNNNGDGPAGDGDGAGVLVTGTRCRVDGNTAINNDRGVAVEGQNNIIVRNVCSGNVRLGAGSNYVISLNNTFGEAVEPSQTLSNFSGNDGGPGVGTNSPWANLSY